MRGHQCSRYAFDMDTVDISYIPSLNSVAQNLLRLSESCQQATRPHLVSSAAAPSKVRRLLRRALMSATFTVGAASAARGAVSARAGILMCALARANAPPVDAAVAVETMLESAMIALSVRVLTSDVGKVRCLQHVHGVRCLQ